MRWVKGAQLLVWSGCIQFSNALGSRVFSWTRAEKHMSDIKATPEPWGHRGSSPQALPSDVGLADVYSSALEELQDLELKPLCHRVAARLLVHNCQLLDGQDEATVLTDSGRATRDFVDSYAASLAICDLERARFQIPAACNKFREPTLARLAPPTTPQLHASTVEIDGCLEGLARSDSAWSTWLSYRHKALRFCEAARIENEKDETIHLYQTVTEILRKLTTQVESELETRFHSLENMFEQANNDLAGLSPQIEVLKSDLNGVRELLSEGILRNAQDAAGSIEHGLDSAKALQQLVAALLQSVLDNNVAIASSQESALQLASKRMTIQFEDVLAVLGTVALSSASLQQDIEISHIRAAQIARQQGELEENMVKLTNLAGELSVQQDRHQQSLKQAQETTSEILDTLSTVSASATSFQNSVNTAFSLGG